MATKAETWVSNHEEEKEEEEEEEEGKGGGGGKTKGVATKAETLGVES